MLFGSQTSQTFNDVVDIKVRGLQNLDKYTRQYCKDSLELFVAFSSVVSPVGNAGQTNYGYANSAMERICEHRQADELPALAIQWGKLN